MTARRAELLSGAVLAALGALSLVEAASKDAVPLASRMGIRK